VRRYFLATCSLVALYDRVIGLRHLYRGLADGYREQRFHAATDYNNDLAAFAPVAGMRVAPITAQPVHQGGC
jgi:hypothetical protein